MKLPNSTPNFTWLTADSPPRDPHCSRHNFTKVTLTPAHGPYIARETGVLRSPSRNQQGDNVSSELSMKACRVGRLPTGRVRLSGPETFISHRLVAPNAQGESHVVSRQNGTHLTTRSDGVRTEKYFFFFFYHRRSGDHEKSPTLSRRLSNFRERHM